VGHTEYHKNPLVKRSLNKDPRRAQNQMQIATTQPTHHTPLTQSPKSPYHSHNQIAYLLHRTPQNHPRSLSHCHQTQFHHHPQCQPSTPPQGGLVALGEHPRMEEDYRGSPLCPSLEIGAKVLSSKERCSTSSNLMASMN